MSQEVACPSDTFEKLRVVRRETLKLVQGLDPDQAGFASHPEEWSVVEILDHLVQTDITFRVQLERLFEAADKGGSRELELSFDDLDSAPAMVPESALPVLEQPLRWMNRMMPPSWRQYLIEEPLVAFRAPAATRPSADRAIDDLRVQLARSVEETIRLAESRKDSEEMVIDHPMLGRNTPVELLDLQWRHEVRHQKQIRALRRDGDFPCQSETRPLPATEISFSEVERDVEKALGDTRQIMDWWQTKTAEDSLELFPLRPGFPPHFEVNGFFDSIHMLGDQEPTSIMGCLQRHRFQRRGEEDPLSARHMESFFDESFFQRCQWKHDDGEVGGFRYRGVCGRDRRGEVVGLQSPLRLAELREDYEWTVLRVDILDFIRSHEQLGRFHEALSPIMTESAYVVLHDDLAKRPGRTPANVVAEVGFGYAFLPRVVEPSIFGFGPGRFGAAMKQWRFLLFKNGEVEARVAFLVTPRSEKVMDIGGLDPFYGPIDLAYTMSLGRLDMRQDFRDRTDRHFLSHHGDVHADVVLGMRDLWEGQRWFPRFDSW